LAKIFSHSVGCLFCLKGIYKNSAAPPKDQTCKSWASKKEKRYKPKA
jgi:hypothetical protein